MAILSTIGTAIRQDWRRIVITGALVALLFQVLMMVALMVRFQALPNYFDTFNWVGNVIHIIKSTPSWSDIPPIVNEEWLIEIGKMNYDYGMGISEWSLNVVPARLAVLFVLGMLIALCGSLLRRDECSVGTGRTLRATTGVGTILIAMTNATMSWVVCCAAPSWVVGLAMLGLGVSTSLALETMGPLLNAAGFGILVAMIFYLAWRKSRTPTESQGVLRHA